MRDGGLTVRVGPQIPGAADGVAGVGVRVDPLEMLKAHLHRPCVQLNPVNKLKNT